MDYTQVPPAQMLPILVSVKIGISMWGWIQNGWLYNTCILFKSMTREDLEYVICDSDDIRGGDVASSLPAPGVDGSKEEL